MQNKQKSTQILSFTSLSILIILTIVFFIAPTKIEDFCKIAIIAITPFSLLTALTLSIIAVYTNKRYVLGWVSLIIIISLFSTVTYLTLELKILPLGDWFH
ncbi:hypothetical protein OIU83_20080 [Flavobacterium sp. LS1R49]|uniref:Uncharacterized protein n=1 Tax=Flavobacterium shii TaxID=2987687 RepID=A0A9X2ZIG4_9FLAO|nr:hypothetical protein [Flavobacterium shii]MCV9929970.1 hypothetical protein [Flavobacterium shii]